MWNREKILDIAERTGMTETQIYKWWWDQTRKRVKRLKTYYATMDAIHQEHSLDNQIETQHD